MTNSEIDDLPSWLRRGDGVWLVSVRAQPSGGRSRIVGTHGDALRIRLSAPANEGKANAELVRFMADVVGVNRSRIAIVSGDRSRDKVVSVDGDIDPLIDAVRAAG